MDAKKLIDIDLLLGEGPVWDDENNTLYWVDIDAKCLYWWKFGSDHVDSCRFDQRVSMVCLTTKGGIMVALENGVYYLSGEKPVLFAENPEKNPYSRFNDGKCDSWGRLWIGTLDMEGKQGQSGFYRFDHDGTCTKVLDNISVSNGLCFSPDQKYLYYIDTPIKRVMRFDFNIEKGSVLNRTEWIDGRREQGFFDGMTIDVEGNLWICNWGGSCVSKWNGRDAKKMDEVIVPDKYVSCCTFGGPNKNCLYITTAASGPDNPGGLYYYKTDTSGFSCNRMVVRKNTCQS